MKSQSFTKSQSPEPEGIQGTPSADQLGTNSGSSSPYGVSQSENVDGLQKGLGDTHEC